MDGCGDSSTGDCEMSPLLSRLFERHLEREAWTGWLDGGTFVITKHDDRRFVCGGYFYWSDQTAKRFWLEAFHASFQLSAGGDALDSYVLGFGWRRHNSAPVPVNEPLKKVYSQLGWPSKSAHVDRSQWVYVFEKTEWDEH